MEWELDHFEDLSGCWLSAETPTGHALFIAHESGYNNYRLTIETEETYPIDYMFHGTVREAKEELEHVYESLLTSALVENGVL